MTVEDAVDSADRPDVVDVPESLLVQVEALEFPSSLVPKLYRKLSEQIFDAGDAFKINYYPAVGYDVVATAPLDAGSDVFLVDHALEFSAPVDYDAELKQYPELVRRLSSLMSIITPDLDLPNFNLAEQDRPAERSQQPTGDSAMCQLLRLAGNPPLSDMEEMQSLFLDKSVMDDKWLEAAPIATFFPGVERLHLEENEIQSLDSVIALLRNLPVIRAVWLRDNPFCSNEALQSQLDSEMPMTVELIDGKATTNYSAWTVETLSGGTDRSILNLRDADLPFLNIGALEACVSERLHTLDLRGNPKISPEEWKPLADLIDSKGITLEAVWADVDEKTALAGFAEVFTNARKINTTPRWMALRQVSVDDPDATDLLREKVVEELPQFALKYQMARPNEPESLVNVFYTLDELGSFVNHSVDPNFRLARVFFGGQTFSMMWPIRAVAEGESITRDFFDASITGERPVAAVVGNTGIEA